MMTSLKILMLALAWIPSGVAWLFASSPKAPVLLELTRRQQGTKRSFYVGAVRAGHGAGGGKPQEMLVFFDTGSGHVLLDSTRCESIPCVQHHQYSPVESARAIGSHVFDMDSHGNQVPIHSTNSTMHFDMADEHTAKSAEAKGDVVHDTMCLGPETNKDGSGSEACADVGFVAATRMSDELFLDAPFDGIVGLGLEGISISTECNWFSRLVAAGSPPQFALFLPAGGAPKDAKAEIAFGGYNPARLASALAWLPVVKPEAGYWQLRVSSVRIGGKFVDCAEYPGGCVGIIDTSSSTLGIPEEVFPEIPAAEGGDCAGPAMVFAFEGNAQPTTLNITSKEYLERADGKCVSHLHPLTSHDRSKTGSKSVNGKLVRAGGVNALMFTLGEPLMRRYYTVFDTETKQVGFGLSASFGPVVGDEIILVQQSIETSKKGPPTDATSCKTICQRFGMKALSSMFGEDFGTSPQQCCSACDAHFA